MDLLVPSNHWGHFNSGQGEIRFPQQRHQRAGGGKIHLTGRKWGICCRRGGQGLGLLAGLLIGVTEEQDEEGPLSEEAGTGAIREIRRKCQEIVSLTGEVAQ